MRSPERQPSPISYGIKQKDLPLIVDHVVEIFTRITDSMIPEWIFHPGRIQNELRQGRKGLDIKLQTKKGSMTLSVREKGDLLTFSLDANKHEKPKNLHSDYSELEQRFESEVASRLCDLGLAQEIFSL